MDANEFYYSPFSENHELIKGEIFPTDFLGAFDGFLLARLGLIISDFVKENNLGITANNVGFVLAKNPDTVRGANLAFVSKSKLSETGFPKKFYPHPPEFIAEFASEHRPFEKVKERADEFLNAGTKTVWIVHRESEKSLTIKTFCADGNTSIISQDIDTSDENVFERFEFFASKLLKHWFI